MRKLLCLLGCIILLSSLALSCKRRPLTYGHYPFSDIVVVPDWSESLVGEDKPLGTSAWFFPKDGSEPLVFKSNNVDGFSVPVPEGVYDILVFNRSENEFSTLGFKGMDKLSTAEVYSIEDETKGWYTRVDGELVVKHPEKIASAVRRDFEVTPEMIATTALIRLGEAKPSDTLTKIHVTPKLLTKIINVRIKIIGIHNLRSARATISGMAQGHWIELNENNTTDATYILENWNKVGVQGEGELYFNYQTFGLLGRGSSNNSTGYEYWTGFMNLEVLLVDNKTVVKFPLPLDHTMITENTAGDVDLTITIGFDPAGPVDPPVLPDVEPDEGDAGFDAEINGWTDHVEIPIPIG